MSNQFQYKKLIRKKYNHQSFIYDELYGEEQRRKYRTIRLEPYLKDPVLDCGCGTGLLLEAIKNLELQIVGLDLSDKMLIKAKRKNLGQKIQLVQADASHLPFIENFFGTICTFTVADHNQLSSLLRQLSESLRSDGILIFSFLKKSATKEDIIRQIEHTRLKIIEIIDGIQDYIVLCRKG
ncbi:class I SAM-dependent DNA methyltransferase [[Eubacterium] cellulosolvens]